LQFQSTLRLVVCVVCVSNCEPAQPLIGGHREVRIKEEIARRHTSHTIYTMHKYSPKLKAFFSAIRTIWPNFLNWHDEHSINTWNSSSCGH